MSQETQVVIMPDNPMSTMTLFDADAKRLDSFVEYITNGIEAGMEDPLKVLALSKKMEYVVKRINDRVKDAAKREAEKNGDRPFDAFGCEVRQEATSTRYDFTVCNDPQWNEANKVVKEREAFLKALKAPQMIVVEETGETIRVSPPRKIQTFGLKVTVK